MIVRRDFYYPWSNKQLVLLASSLKPPDSCDSYHFLPGYSEIDSPRFVTCLHEVGQNVVTTMAGQLLIASKPQPTFLNPLCVRCPAGLEM